LLYATVHLYGRNGASRELRDYERKALAIFRKHGGEVVIAYTPERGEDGRDMPDEIQVLRISDRDRFEAFMRDPDRTAMAEERERAIRRTDVFLSGGIVDYGA
jgi:uncharacterized protein (DUF1330 family)